MGASKFAQRTTESLTFKERIEYCKDNQNSNCAGTALFIAGVKPFQAYTDHNEVVTRISTMKRVEYPIIGCIVAWEQPRGVDGAFETGKFFVHLGVVTSQKPLLVTHRFNNEGRLYIDQPIEVMNQILSIDKQLTQVAFYTPRNKLQERLRKSN
ncbi:MAG: hypothetical protein KGH94_04335 [Candidatus Micrarchaeota archaeon]|nr:hypothetical protein [Candidatus Micrarchaeota archaeon]